MGGFMRIRDPEVTRFRMEDFPFNIFDINNTATLAHWHNHLEIIRILEGDIVVVVNDTKIQVGPGDVLMIAPGCLHSIECVLGHYKAIVIGDKLLSALKLPVEMKDVLRQFTLEDQFEYVVYGSKDPNTKLIGTYLDEMEEEFSERHEGQRVMIQLSICRMMVSMVRMGDLQGSVIHKKPSLQHIKTALTYIDDHYKEAITLKKIGQLTNLSEQHFSRIFKGYMGKTFMDYLKLYRLDLSNWYLKHTEIPITQIPEKVGICNANYYARLYKSHYGQSPSEARKLMKSKPST